jgi:tagatose-1,6-bisphosphate aldolase non-catalytic subunit AgaZ/GatZ
VQTAVEHLLQNLTTTGLPDELVSQHLSWANADEVAGAGLSDEGEATLTPEGVLRLAVRRVLDVYRSAL